MSKLSKMGLLLAGIYVVATAIIFYQAFTCHGEFCGFMALILVTPWTFAANFLAPTFLGSLLNDWFGLIFFAFLNAMLLYFVGKYIEIIFTKLRTSKASSTSISS